MLTQQRLKDQIEYEPETGNFRWLVSKGPRRAGSAAGGVSGGNYRRIAVDGRIYLAHRLAWLYVNGSLPKDAIDHANGITTDNRITNLRIASKSQNMMNSKILSKNSTGVKNVSRNGSGFLVSIKAGDKRVSKWFSNLSDAADCAKSLRESMHGDYACERLS
jgi:phosphotransferase system IIB component